MPGPATLPKPIDQSPAVDPAGGAGALAPVPASPIAPEEAAAAVAAAWVRHGADVPTDADALLSPHGLDLLDALPDSHPLRLGLAVKVYHVDRSGTRRLVARDWTVVVPTEAVLASLVADEGYPPGTYWVRLSRGKTALPYVRVHVAAPVRGAPDHASPDPLSIAREVVGWTSGARPAAADERLRAIEQRLDVLGAMLGDLAAAAAQMVDGSRKGAAGSDAGAALVRLAERVLPDVLAGAASARNGTPPAPRAPAGYSP